MNGAKKRGIIFLLTGTTLIFAAMSLFLYNMYEDTRAGQEAEQKLASVQEVIHENKDDSPPQQDIPFTEITNPKLSVVEIDGYGYIGYIYIPSLELKLPIMSEWDYKRLKIAPCRQFGSSITDDMVIVAHNYKKHFGQISKLKIGDTVCFTDMDGEENVYKVVVVDVLAPTDVDKVQNSEHDLVLYTCTSDGKARVAVFCDRE